ncbi:IclR family transcriptional regulator [Natronolimnobius baerhuensis]|uniref:Transcriptional regulator, IclR family protein n=1 Tax=Natronolimnobius baerhuensis TaxID=253108 RepID=A0A202E3S2_9EURY|nr:IclR family transcriptional regulator [Natronolimnobius baerhuensis]OVE82854.1 transcriptional regulator, IclR family protein [Natronolimnobius baerhuensis]
MTTPNVPPGSDDQPTATTSVTSVRVIEALKDRHTAGITQLASELELSKGTVHKHLNTLRQLDYVVKDGHEYRLSVSFLGLGTSARAQLPIYDAALHPLEDLASATGETASLMIPEHGYGIYIAQERGARQDTNDVRVGDRLPMHATAGGKAILSYLPQDERDMILGRRGMPALTEHTITDRAELEDELQLVRDRRTAYDRGEHRSDRHCIAHPVMDNEERAIAAVSVSGPATRMKRKDASTDFESLVGSTINSIRNRLSRLDE